jgi:hypothetical protein
MTDDGWDIWDRNDDRSVVNVVKRLESSLSLPVGFCEGLLAEDDWSLVIKLHALIEAAVSRVIAAKIGCQDLERVLSHLELSRDKCGKVEFANALGLLGKEDRRFIRGLSELRNRLVHDVTNVTFSMREYVASLNSQQQTKFITTFAFAGLHPGSPIPPEFAEYVRKKPKTALWKSALYSLACIRLEEDLALNEQEVAATRESNQKLMQEIKDLMDVIKPASQA